VESLIAQMDLVVIPSWKENLPYVALEAMRAAKPIVAANVGGLPEVIIDGVTGLLVPPQNPIQLANAITDLLSNGKNRHHMGVAGRKRLEEHFTQECMTNEVISIYRKALANRGNAQ
jgi:glycosyltransferase involved in cell wall biosynthesis